MKLIKKFIIILYAAIIIIMGIATFIEHSKGTMFASTEIYGSWWFCALWGILTAAAVFFFNHFTYKKIWYHSSSCIFCDYTYRRIDYSYIFDKGYYPFTKRRDDQSVYGYRRKK